MDLPEEIIYKVFSYLPAATLTALNLTNKQYWNIYRMRTSSSKWDDEIDWRLKFIGTDEMVLKDRLYIHSLCSLQERIPSTFTHIPVENKTVIFQKYLDGYVWHPLGKVDITKMKQILNPRDKSLTYFKVSGLCCGSKELEIFNKYILRHVWRNIPKDILEYCCEYSDYDQSQCSDDHIDSPAALVRFPNDEEIDVPLVLYLTESTVDLNSISLVFTDEVEIDDDYILWKVFKVSKQGEQIDIGRAVLSPKLHKMMNSDVGVALLGSEDKVFAIGNFDYLKVDRDVLRLIPKSVFDTYNFVVVKKSKFYTS